MRYLLFLLALTGCTGSSGETYLGLPGSPAWFRTASPQTIASYFGERCQSYGFKADTPEMAQCIQNEALNRRSSNAARSAAIAAQSRPRQTRCTGFGNSVNCTTF